MVQSDTLNNIESGYSSITEEYSTLLSKVTDSISFSTAGLEDAKETLTDYVIKFNSIRDEKTVTERVLKGVSSLPLVGGFASSAVKDIKSERINQLSISKVVDDLYEGLKRKSNTLENTLNSLVEVSNSTTSINKELTTLDSKLSSHLEDIDNTHPDYISAIRVSSQLKLLIDNTSSKRESLLMIIQVGTGLLTTMVKILPVSKTELLSNMAMDSGVSQINSISKDVQDIAAMTQDVSDAIHKKTHKAVIELIELSTISDKEVKRLEDNSRRRIALTNEVSEAVSKMNKSLVVNHSKITSHMLSKGNPDSNDAEGNYLL